MNAALGRCSSRQHRVMAPGVNQSGYRLRERVRSAAVSRLALVRFSSVIRVEAAQYARQFHRDLKSMAEGDPEQELRGSVLTVLEALLQASRDHVVGTPVATKIDRLLSPETGTGRPVRAGEAALVVGQLAAALDHEASRINEVIPLFNFPKYPV